MSAGPEPDGVEAPPAASRGRGYLRSTLKHGAIYTIGTILSRLVSFIMIPVYTRVLTPADYGVLEILGLTTDVLGMLAGMGIGLAVMRQYHSVESDAERRVVASSAATLLTVVFGAVAALGVALSGWITPVLLGEGGSTHLVRVAAVSLALGSTIEVPLAVLRAQVRSTIVVTVGLSRLLIGLALNILFVVVLRLGVAGVLYSSAITSAIVGGTLAFQLYRSSGMHLDLRIVRRLVAFGSPLIVWNVASFVMHYSDRYFLRVYDSLAVVGLYSLGYKLAMLIPMFASQPFNDVWIPKALEIEKREGPDAAPILLSIIQVYNLVLVTVAFAVALSAADVVRLATGSEFHTAGRIVPPLALAMVFFCYRNIAQIGALVRGRSDIIATATAVAALLMVVLNLVLIPVWGAAGAAAGKVGAFVGEFLLLRYLASRVHPVRAGLGMLFAPILVATAIVLASLWLVPPDAPVVLSLLYDGIAFAAYVGALFATGAIPRDLRPRIIHAVRHPREALRVLRGA